MARIILDEKVLKFSSLFESLTGARLKDCFIDEGIIIFVVEQGEISRAIGKKAVNVKRIERLLNSKIKLVEYADIPEEFIPRLVFPAKIKNLVKENNVYTIIPMDLHSRGLMIGRNAQNLRNYEKIVKRYFKIDELKVK